MGKRLTAVREEVMVDPVREERVRRIERSLTIYGEIQAERERQDVRWGEQDHHPVYWTGILAEELGEVAQAAIELNGRCARTMDDAEDALRGLRLELVQLAAVAVAALECLDRGRYAAADGQGGGER